MRLRIFLVFVIATVALVAGMERTWSAAPPASPACGPHGCAVPNPKGTDVNDLELHPLARPLTAASASPALANRALASAVFALG